MGYMQEFGLSTNGNVEELKAVFSEFTNKEGLSPNQVQRLQELERQHSRSPSPSPSGAQTLSIPSATAEVTVHKDDNKIELERLRSRNVSPGPSTAQRRNSSPNRNTATERQHTAMTAVQTNIRQPTKLDSQNLNYGSMLNQVRKWDVRFDDKMDPLDFVERLEELADAYGIPQDVLPRAMPEVLQGKGLQWLRNNKKPWLHWGDFKHDFLKFFLSSLYRESLDDKVRQRFQGSNELFKDFVIAMQTLMRHTGYAEADKIERIYRNSRRDYQLYVKRRDFQTLEQLVDLCDEYENILGHRKTTTTQEIREAKCRGMNSTSEEKPRGERNPQRSNDVLNPQTACRRCGADGHLARGCRNPVMLFCWQCGRKGLRTIECCKKAGNASGPQQ